MLEDNLPGCHIIFLDLNMPKMNGKQFLAAIKQNKVLSKIPIVIFTTSQREKDSVETINMGASYFLTKPSSFGELCKQLEEILSMELN
jgi:DNA-binding response OmpR family regulator